VVPKYLCIQTSILALVRGKLSARAIADRMGVTEEQVLRWRDTFLTAGTIALADELRGHQGGKIDYLSTCMPDDPTTTTTTTPDPGTGTGTLAPDFEFFGKGPDQERRTRTKSQKRNR
jgi:hypothetical protein